MDHWRRGHKQMCKKIHRGGNAEQYHADKKYKEAVAVAVEACAEDTKGQTCFICTQALHWKTKEGLVRGCACRGTAGFVHVSCLAEQAKILVAEAEENNLEWKVKSAKWDRWHRCSLCEQHYHDEVRCALGWACWKTYLGRPETDWAHGSALMALGHGLSSGGHYDECVAVNQANLDLCKRHNVPENRCLDLEANIAACYQMTGREAEAIALQKSIYARSSVMKPIDRLSVANNLAEALGRAGHHAEARTLLRKTIPSAQSEFGDDHRLTLFLRQQYASRIIDQVIQDRDFDAREDVAEALAVYEDVYRRARRVFGAHHPQWTEVPGKIKMARELLGHLTNLSDAVDAAALGLVEESERSGAA